MNRETLAGWIVIGWLVCLVVVWIYAFLGEVHLTVHRRDLSIETPSIATRENLELTFPEPQEDLWTLSRTEEGVMLCYGEQGCWGPLRFEPDVR